MALVSKILPRHCFCEVLSFPQLALCRAWRSLILSTCFRQQARAEVRSSEAGPQRNRVIVHLRNIDVGDSLKVVVKLGGFVFPSDPDPTAIRSYADALRRVSEEGHRLVVIAGGGGDARKYIKAARRLGASEYICDLLGIEVSRLNARLLSSTLGELAYPELPTSLSLLRDAFEVGKIVVAGGMQPAQSTNAVAALSAEAVGADLLVNATNVDGVYTSDPKSDPSARKLDAIETRDLLRLVLNGRMDAGTYELFDPVAIRIVERSGVRTRILDGRTPGNIEKAARGESIGTLVLASGRFDK